MPALTRRRLTDAREDCLHIYYGDVHAGTVFAGSSPITFTSPASKAHQKSGLLLRRHCTASTLIRPCPTPALAATCRNVEAATLADDGSPAIIRTTIPTCRAHYPRRIKRVRVSIASPLMQPSPNGRRVGIRIVTFEACSGLTHVTARRIAQPPKATFVTRLQPFRASGRAARQLSDQSTILWVDSSSTSDSRLRARCQQRTYDTGGVDLGLAVASCASTAVTSRSAISRVAACALAWSCTPREACRR